MTSKRWVFVLLVIAVGVLGGVFPSRASCAPPTVQVEAFTAQVGDEIKITGQAWISGCDDTPDDGGCATSAESTPVEDIELYLKGPKSDQTQAQLDIGRIGDTKIDIQLATVDADSEGGFVTSVEVPDVPEGIYFVTAEGHLPAYQPPQINILDR